MSFSLYIAFAFELVPAPEAAVGGGAKDGRLKAATGDEVMADPFAVRPGTPVLGAVPWTGWRWVGVAAGEWVP